MFVDLKKDSKIGKKINVGELKKFHAFEKSS
jgi:hypothetical protein